MRKAIAYSSLLQISREEPWTALSIFHLHLHLSLNRQGRWGTTYHLTTSFLHFSLSSTALWNLANSQTLTLYLFVCPPYLPPPLSLCLAKWVSLMEGRHAHTTVVCVSLRWTDGHRVVRLPAGSWHGLPHWCHGLCMKCVLSCGSTSFLCIVFFFAALL